MPRNIVAEELLRAEGFTEIVYVDTPARVGSAKAIADRVDFTLSFAVNHILAIDAGAPITVLGGVHIGCYELFASEGIRTITGLMGKSVGLDAAAPALLSLLAADVGLDPERISAGSPAPIRRSTRWSFLPRARSTPILGFPQSHRYCMRARWAM